MKFYYMAWTIAQCRVFPTLSQAVGWIGRSGCGEVLIIVQRKEAAPPRLDRHEGFVMDSGGVMDTVHIRNGTIIS